MPLPDQLPPLKQLRRVWLSLAAGITLIAALLLSRCAGDGTQPVLTSFRISGTLQDSVAARSLAGYTLIFGVDTTNGFDSTVTDSTGFFAITVRARPDTLRVRIVSWFEQFQRALSGSRDTTLTIRLRRIVPFVHGFSVSPTGVLQATVVHLRGATQIMQDAATWVVFYDPSIVQSGAIPATQWTWQTIDSLTWHVSVPTGFTGITGALWNVADSTYGAALTQCTTGNTNCTDNANLE